MVKKISLFQLQITFFLAHYMPITSVDLHCVPGSVDFSPLCISGSMDFNVKLWNLKVFFLLLLILIKKK